MHFERQAEKTDVHLTLVARNKSTTVVLDDGRELGSGEPSVRHPARELVIPDTVVAFSFGSASPPIHTEQQ